MESIVKVLTIPLETELTLHTIFFFWYAIMLGTMLGTIGSRPKRNELKDGKQDVFSVNKEIIAGINTQIKNQNKWKRSNQKGIKPDRLIEGLLSFETVEVWELLRSFLVGKNPDYKLPDQIDVNDSDQIKRLTGYNPGLYKMGRFLDISKFPTHCSWFLFFSLNH